MSLPLQTHAPSRWTPELELAAACCRWPPSPDRDAAVRAASARGIDWDRFRRVVVQHRIAPLARDGVRRAGVAVPPMVAKCQAEAAADAARRALLMASETLRIQQAFDEAGLPALFVKGATLAMLAYGELGMKDSWDIDLLTTPECALAARRLLLQLGYRTVPDVLSDEDRFKRLVDLSKEATFRHAESGLWVDLHWRLLDIRGPLQGVGAQSQVRNVQIVNTSVRTLRDEDLFAYLCAHGAGHSWSRLKWIADLSALLGSGDDTRIERLVEAATVLGVGRCAAAALIVRECVLGLEVPANLRRAVASDFGTKFLAANSLACIAYRGGAVEHTRFSAAWARTLIANYLLTPGGASFFQTLRSHWNSTQDRTEIMLPRGLAFLYHVVRIPLWFWRASRRAIGRQNG